MGEDADQQGHERSAGGKEIEHSYGSLIMRNPPQMVNASKEAMWGSGMGMMIPSAPLPPSISGQEMGRVEIQRGEERGLARPVQ